MADANMHDVVVNEDEYLVLAQEACKMCSEMDAILDRFVASLQRVSEGMEGEAATAITGLLSNIEPLCKASSATAEQSKARLARFVEQVDAADSELY